LGGLFGIGGGGGHPHGGGQQGDYFFGGAEQFNALLHALMQGGGGGRRASPPASAAAVAGLADVVLDAEGLASSANSDCSVCLENFAVGDVVKQLPCRHTFHPQCLLPWLKEHNSWSVRESDRDEQRRLLFLSLLSAVVLSSLLSVFLETDLCICVAFFRC
jgi:hypothetical protein